MADTVIQFIVRKIFGLKIEMLKIGFNHLNGRIKRIQGYVLNMSQVYPTMSENISASQDKSELY